MSAEETYACTTCGETTDEPGREGETYCTYPDGAHQWATTASTPPLTGSEIPTCSMCRRTRTLGDSEHPMDAYDYTPMQVITGQPLGWYSGDDGEMCPECMTKTLRAQS